MTPQSGEGGLAENPSPGKPPIVPDHELLRIIGSGSYGDVWLGRSAIGTYRAIKVVYRTRFKDARPYEREFSGIQKFEPVSRAHEGLVDVLQIGRNDELECFYCVMELADPADSGCQMLDSGSAQRAARREGATSSIQPELYIPHTLALDLERRRRLPVSECVQRGLALSIALEFLHSQGLVHRDIKPSNVIFVNGTPKLADIGLVAEAGEGGSLVGTVGFMPPEGPGTVQADIFSLGKVLYEISTGKDREQWPRPVTELAALEDREQWLELNEVIARACESDLRRRYESASELRSDLALLLGGQSVRHLRRRERTLRRLLAVAAIGMIIALAVAGVQRMRTIRARERENAARELTKAAEKVAEEQTRGSELRDAKILRLGLRTAGWYSEYAAHLERALKIRSDNELLDEAAVGLAGLEMRIVMGLSNMSGSSVAFGRQGQVIFGGLTNGRAHLLHPGTTNLEEMAMMGDGPVGFDPHERPVQFVFIGQGQFALRDVGTGELYRRFNLDGEPVTGYDGHPMMAIAPDLSKVAAAVQSSGGGHFAIWDVATGKELGVRDKLVTAMAFAPDGNSLAIGDADGHVTVLAVPGLIEIARLRGERAEIHSLAFGRDPAVLNSTTTNLYPWLLAAGDSAAAIAIYQLATGEGISKCPGSAYDIHALAFRSDGAILASAGRNELRIWDVATGEPLLRNLGVGRSYSIDYARGLAFSRDDRRLAIATQYLFVPASVSVWDIEEGRGIQTLHGMASQTEHVWWSPDSTHVAALAHNWEIGIWEIPGGRLTHLFQVPIGASPDNAFLVFDTGGRRAAFAAGSRVCLYDLAERRLVQSWPIPLGYCDSLRFEGDNRLLFLHSEMDAQRKRTRTWALRNLLAPQWQTPIWEQPDTNWITWGTALPPGGDYFLVWGGMPDTGSEIRAIGTETGKELWRIRSGRSYRNCNVACDPTGRVIAYPIAEYSQEARIVRLPDGEFVGEMEKIPEAINPSAQHFAVRADTGWSLYENGAYQHAARLGIGFRPTNRPEFSPDGLHLAMPTAEGYVLVADLAKVQKHLRAFGWKP